MSESKESTRLGNRIRQRRLALNLTQKEVAAAVHCDPSYISQVETGRIYNPKYPLLRDIAKALETTLDDLLQAAGYVSLPDEVLALDDPELMVYLNGVAKLPKHDREIIKGVLKSMEEAHEKYGKEND